MEKLCFFLQCFSARRTGISSVMLELECPRARRRSVDVCACAAAKPEVLLNFLLTPDQRSGSVVERIRLCQIGLWGSEQRSSWACATIAYNGSLAVVRA
jgi:hypothetical protein